MSAPPPDHRAPTAPGTTAPGTTRPPGRAHPTTGILALVFGLTGIVFVLPLIGPLLALVFGYLARGDAERQPEHYSDELGRAGRVLGWIGLVLSLVVLAAVVGFVGLFLGPGGRVGMPVVRW